MRRCRTELKIKVEVELPKDLALDVFLYDERRVPSLAGPIGPFSEQELSPMPNTAVTLTDSQKYAVGPFTGVDKKGKPTGPATGVSGASGDATILTVTDNGDGTFTVLAAGELGQAQATFTDDKGATFITDNTVIAGAEAALSAPVSAPVEQ
jgi:hypothetical protein